jgi:hypothetical protein
MEQAFELPILEFFFTSKGRICPLIFLCRLEV